MKNSTEPLQDAKVGDVIGMDLIPDYVWTGPILEVEACDPDGNEDWLCAYDAHKATR